MTKEQAEFTAASMVQRLRALEAEVAKLRERVAQLEQQVNGEGTTSE